MLGIDVLQLLSKARRILSFYYFTQNREPQINWNEDIHNIVQNVILISHRCMQNTKEYALKTLENSESGFSFDDTPAKHLTRGGFK